MLAAEKCPQRRLVVMVDRLIPGIARFAQEVMPHHAERFAELASGQSPHTLFITCADSRIDPSLITQTDPGELFVIRNAGNIVPALDADGSSGDGTAASIEFAVAVLAVQHIVVCGHSGCGAMAGLIDPASLDTLPSVARWVAQSGADPEGHDMDSLIRQNVLQQLEDVAAYPAVRKALDQGAVSLHGWVYDIGTGVVEGHDGTSFTPLAG